MGLAEARAKQKPLNEPYQVLSQASGAVAAMPAYGFGVRLEEALVVLHFTPNPLSTKPDQIPSFTPKWLILLAKQATLNQRVQGSNPCTPTKEIKHLFRFQHSWCDR